MSVKVYVGGKPAYTFLSTGSAEEFIEAQTDAVRRRWPMAIRITRNRNGPQGNGARQPELPSPSPPRAEEVPADEDTSFSHDSAAPVQPVGGVWDEQDPLQRGPGD